MAGFGLCIPPMSDDAKKLILQQGRTYRRGNRRNKGEHQKSLKPRDCQKISKSWTLTTPSRGAGAVRTKYQPNEPLRLHGAVRRCQTTGPAEHNMRYSSNTCHQPSKPSQRRPNPNPQTSAQQNLTHTHLQTSLTRREWGAAALPEKTQRPTPNTPQDQRSPEHHPSQPQHQLNTNPTPTLSDNTQPQPRHHLQRSPAP